MITVKNKGLELPNVIRRTYVFFTALERVAVEAEAQGARIIRLKVYSSKTFSWETRTRRLLDEFFYIDNQLI